MSKNLSLAWKLIPAYFAIAFIFGYAVGGPQVGSMRRKFSRPRVAMVESTYASGKPNRVVIPDLAIDVKVIDGNYSKETKNWDVSKTYANFATISPLINTSGGNTVIYGHNSANIFGKTKNIKLGTSVYIYTDNGNVFEYKYVEDKLVLPTDTSIFDPNGKPRVTLITCMGAFNEKRRLMGFELKGVSKI